MERLRGFERWSRGRAALRRADDLPPPRQIVPPGYRDAVEHRDDDRPPAGLGVRPRPPISLQRAVQRPTGHGRRDRRTPHGPRVRPRAVPTRSSARSRSPRSGWLGRLTSPGSWWTRPPPGGDLIALAILTEDWYRQAEIRIYNALNTAQGGTITGDFAANGAQAVSDASPTTTLHTTLKKRLLDYAVLRRRKARNVIVGRAALDNLAGLLTAEDTTGDDTCLAKIWGSGNAWSTISPPARPTAGSRSWAPMMSSTSSPRSRRSGSTRSAARLRSRRPSTRTTPSWWRVRSASARSGSEEGERWQRRRS